MCTVYSLQWRESTKKIFVEHFVLVGLFTLECMRVALG